LTRAPTRTSHGPAVGACSGAAAGREPTGHGGVRVGVYAAVTSVIVLAGLGALAIAFRQPLLFPSVGPTVMVLAERPRSASAHPRNVVLGHLVGVAAGVAALVVCGLWSQPSVMVDGVTVPRIAAAALSLAVTSLLLQLLHAPHAPAGATTLIVSLGLLKSADALLAILVAISFVTAVATALNLLSGARTTLTTDRDPSRPSTGRAPR
jgi:hypothetical protein